MTSNDIMQRLHENFPGAEIKALDLTGTGDHWSVTIKSELFNEKSMVEQHQMVYKALGEWMKKEIHALQLNTHGTE